MRILKKNNINLLNEVIQVATYTTKEAQEPRSVKTLIGKRIIASNGEEVGKVTDMIVDEKNMKLNGIYFSPGIFEEKHFIGVEYIDKLGEEGILLNTVPLNEFVGKKVYDREGTLIGSVKEINRRDDSNELMTITVDRGITRPDLTIAEEDIRYNDNNFVLEKAIEE